jgi:hypothetical protein
MKYLCLAYYDAAKFDALSKSELAELVKQCPPHDRELSETGRLVAQASLGRGSKAIRPRRGKISVTDGPFIETHEQVGGFFLIEADDLDDAIRIASKHPAAHLGEDVGWGIEIFPIGRLQMSNSDSPVRSGDE